MNLPTLNEFPGETWVVPPTLGVYGGLYVHDATGLQ